MPKVIYQCGQLEIDVTRRELRVRGVTAPIGGRAFEIIEALVQAAGELVTKDDLMERVWPGAIVEESTLFVHISAVRRALGPERGILKTVARRGYRLLGTWKVVGDIQPIDQLGSHPAETAATPTFANNLPAAGINLIGREQAVRELQDRLSAYRVVTLTGPGGIGKSRLALEVARRVLAEGHGDVWLVELAALSDPNLVPAAVATSLGLRTGTADLSPKVVAHAIGQRTLLLLLDNCEHIVDAAARFAEAVVHLCPHATILATSREVLRIDGECVYNVPPLDVPNQPDAPGDILGSSAVQLFVARTMAINSAFFPDDTSLGEIASICRRLDGIPLAIEFAAARAATLGVSVVDSHLDDRFNLLTAGRRTTLARHQTLRATLDWSYDLLTASEQRLLRHLSVFPAGFALEAAIAVTGNSSHEVTVIDGIANLVGKSLVMLDTSAPGGRWRLLETIRVYGLEKLRETGEADCALRRQAEYFHTLLTPTGMTPHLEPWREALTHYIREIDNIRAALDWCFSQAGDVSIGAAITALYVPVWIHLALVVECRRRTESALAALDEVNGDATSRMLLNIGFGIALNLSTGRSDEASETLTKGLRAAEELGDTVSQMYALWALWFTNELKGNFRATEPIAEKFLRVAVDSADPAIGYRTDCGMGDRLAGTSMHYRGNQLKAREHLDLVADKYRRSLQWSHCAWFGYDFSDFAQSTLARVLFLQGFVDQARNLAQACIDRAQMASQKITLCFSLGEAACPIALFLGDVEAASRHITLFANTATEADLIYYKIRARCLQGMLLIRQGKFDAGIIVLRASLEACDELGGTARYPMYLGAIAKGLSELGKISEARNTLDQALAKADRDGEEWCIPDLLCSKGELALRESSPSSLLEAEDSFSRARIMARQQGALLWELRSALHLARLHVAQERAEEARRVLAPVYGQFAEGFDTADLQAAKSLLDSLSSGTPPSSGSAS
jgi:predicted ATPase/DNA-binding winged helix-turn-helix (wHTH) protein